MKKLALLLPLLLILPLVLAQEEVKSGITADSIFYPLELAFEKVQIALTLNDFAKAQKQLRFSEERLEEIKELSTKKDKSKEITKTQKKYEEYFIKAKQRAKSIENKEDRALVESLINAKNEQHLIILNNLKGLVPLAAQKGIDTAIENSQKWKEKAAKEIPQPEVTKVMGSY